MAATATASTLTGQLETLRATFASGRTRPLAWRLEQLQQLERLIRENEARLFEVLRADLGKPAVEAFAGEVGFVAAEAAYLRKRLPGWMRPERVRTPLHSQPGTSTIRREPLGVVLVIGPWNYPLQLLLSPLAGALAAGNCAVLKPSEHAEQTSRALAELVPRYLDPAAVAVVEGGVPETTALLAERFDHVFFTGSTGVGRVVAEAAARQLTPVTLELGGKSPCLVDREVDLEVAARRIAWGKFFNAGQTCVAPDYVLVDQRLEQPFLSQLRTTLREFYGEDPRQSPDYARIVNARHHQRLQGLLGAGEVVVGGAHDEGERYFAPTVLKGVPLDAPVMQDEIFGPILPVIPVPDMDAAIEFVNARPRPLALYLFSRSWAVQERVLARTCSGGACVNDTVAHLAVPDLPFGGVGHSGYGAYHGRHSFETFSHRRAVLTRSTRIDVKLRYPPYTDLKWFRRLL